MDCDELVPRKGHLGKIAVVEIVCDSITMVRRIKNTIRKLVTQNPYEWIPHLYTKINAHI